MSKLQKIILSVLSVALVILVVLAALSGGKTKKDSSSEFIKPSFDALAMDGIPSEVPTEFRYREAQVSPNLKIAMCGNLICDDEGVASIYLTSFDGNNGYMRVILYDDNGNALGQTGLIKPGQYVNNIRLDNIPQNSGIVNAKLLTYDEQNYCSLGSVNIKVNLSVI